MAVSVNDSGEWWHDMIIDAKLNMVQVHWGGVMGIRINSLG